MKKLLLVFGFLFFTVFTQAQIISIPNANFKTALLNYTPAIDTNSDGEIQVSEALAVTYLCLTSFDYGIPQNISNQTTDLNGIEAFTNLEQLLVNGTAITNFDATSLTQLTTLEFRTNPQLSNINLSNLINLTTFRSDWSNLTTLDVSTLTNLTSLYCYSNFLTSLNLSNLTNLYGLFCGHNQLTQLNLSNQTQLNYLDCSNNNLTTLVLTNNHQLQEIYCPYNQLTDLIITDAPNLRTIECSSNQFTSLDFSHTGVLSPGGPSYVYVNDLPLLTFLNLKTGRHFVTGGVNVNYPIPYVCTDDFNINYLLNTNFTGGTNIGTYCAFVPGGNYNTITANVKYDINNNGCDINDILVNNVKILVNYGTTTEAAFTNTTGNAIFYTQAGNFVITPNFENSFFTISPASSTVNFANTNNNSQTRNFCITPLGIHNDLEITIIPTSPANPGFNASYRLVYKNKGNQVQSGSVNLNFNDAVLDFVSANPVAASQSLNNLNWNFTNLNPFESRTIDFVLNLNSPQETPAVNINDLLSYLATISPTQNDETIEDNTSNFRQTVIGSFDPNDKTCLEGNAITPEMVGDYLHYVIRFQNSGTAAAQNIVVKDIIDTTKFDINTFQLTNSSHPNVTRITGNKVEFIFENINLPAEVNNEPGSHGYVAFKIKSKSNLVLGNTIQNTANIYFDYNFPIVTNTASTIVAVLHVNDFENTTVSIAPIPVVDVLQIKALENITKVQLFDIQGRLLQTNVADSTTSTLDFSGKSKGVYLVKVQTENGIKVQKVIKE